jgi:dTDP-3,4-didehydro-2,6-dideoxy-alpha-D-glucose 3-reductase
MSPLRVGLLGTADFAHRKMLPAMAAHPEIEVAAVASRDPGRAAEVAAAYSARPAAGYEDLLAQDDVDAIYLPLPLALHATWTEAALRAGKHVLGEKPLTVHPDQTRLLHALAGAWGLVLMENVLFVHHSQHARVRALLRSGAIGRPRFLEARFTIPRRPAGDIRYDAALGGGALWDTGVYPVRAALELLPGRLRVIGASLTGGPGDEVATSGAALLEADGGVAVQLAFGIDHAYASRYTIWGSAGRLTLDRAFTPPAGHVPVVELEDGGGVTTVELTPCDQIAAGLDAFVAAVRAGRTPRAAVSAAVRQAEILTAIQEAVTPQRQPEVLRR